MSKYNLYNHKEAVRSYWFIAELCNIILATLSYVLYSAHRQHKSHKHTTSNDVRLEHNSWVTQI